MERLARLQARIRGISDLHEVVGTMRSLAAVRMRQATESLDGARDYAQIIDAALADALTLVEPSQWPRWERPRFGHCGLLVFCSEHGFVGAFNEVLLERARTGLGPRGSLFVIGGRGHQTAREKGLEVTWNHPMTSHRDGVPALARSIADALYHRFLKEEVIRLDMMFARSGAGGHWTVARESLLPLDPRRFAAPARQIAPLHHLPPVQLLELLAEEHFLAQLVHGAMESLAGENAARLAAMSAAFENITRKLDTLRRLEHQVRQEEITTELLDVVTGSEALLSRRH